MVPLPGNARPMASERQFMVFAVNMPEQEPQPGQALSSTLRSSCSLMRPARSFPTASNTLLRSVLLSPASMGPPLTTMVGIFSLSAAMSMPGTHLSQLGISTSPSKGWAVAMISTESAMISREGRENLIPS